MRIRPKLFLRRTATSPGSAQPAKNSFSSVDVPKGTPPPEKEIFNSAETEPERRAILRKNSQRSNYAFIDSQNLNVGVQKFGWKMDWKKFRKFLHEQYGVEKAFMFIGYVPEFEAMYEQLHESGYLVVLKPTFDMTRPQPVENQEAKQPSKGHRDEKEERQTKGNVDADLVLWAMKELPNYHKAVIVSGDGDFYSLVEYLDERKKLLKLLAPNAHYSGLYNKYEKYVERLDTKRRELAYYSRSKPKTDFSDR